MSEGASFSDALTAARGDRPAKRRDLLDRLRDRSGRVAEIARTQRSRATRAASASARQRTLIVAALGLGLAGAILWYALAGGPSADDPGDRQAALEARVELPPLASAPVSLSGGDTAARQAGASTSVAIPSGAGGSTDGSGTVGGAGLTGAAGVPGGTGSAGIPGGTGSAGALATAAAGLVPAPVADLLADSPVGPLPVRAADGRTPLDVYSRPPPPVPADRPLLSLVLADFGLSDRLSEAALDRLPADIALMLSPRAADPAAWADRARSAGHEILVGVPMEPTDYPLTDPGPGTLLTNLGPAQNLNRLHRVLTDAPGAIGIVPVAGGAFTASEDALAPILTDLATRGLMVLDTRAALDPVLSQTAARAGLPMAQIDAVVGETLAVGAIDARLLALEAIARRDGQAVGWLVAKPIVIDRVAEWVAGLTERGVTLAPVSALADRSGAGR